MGNQGYKSTESGHTKWHEVPKVFVLVVMIFISPRPFTKTGFSKALRWKRGKNQELLKLSGEEETSEYSLLVPERSAIWLGCLRRSFLSP